MNKDMSEFINKLILERRMNPIDEKDLESILHRLVVDIAKNKEVLCYLASKQSLAELLHMMGHLFHPRKD